jgi:hypothetical protein
MRQALCLMQEKLFEVINHFTLLKRAWLAAEFAELCSGSSLFLSAAPKSVNLSVSNAILICALEVVFIGVGGGSCHQPSQRRPPSTCGSESVLPDPTGRGTLDRAPRNMIGRYRKSPSKLGRSPA